MKKGPKAGKGDWGGCVSTTCQKDEEESMSAVETHKECWYFLTSTVVPSKENIPLNLN